MKDFVYFAELFDCYKGLLTSNEVECFNAYYCENFSMQEIADEKNVSKSAVSKNIRVVVDKLNNYEKILHLNAKNRKLNEIINMIDDNNVKKILEDIINE